MIAKPGCCGLARLLFPQRVPADMSQQLTRDLRERWQGQPESLAAWCNPKPLPLPSGGALTPSHLRRVAGGHRQMRDPLKEASILTIAFDLLGNLNLTSQVAQMVKCLPAMQETWVRSLGWEDPLEKAVATHSSTLAWKIPWTEEPGRLQSIGWQRIGHAKCRTHFHFLLGCRGDDESSSYCVISSDCQRKIDWK